MDALQIFVLVGFGLVALALLNGIVSMAHGGAQSTRFMFKRVGWQALAVAAILLGLLAS